MQIQSTGIADRADAGRSLKDSTGRFALHAPPAKSVTTRDRQPPALQQPPTLKQAALHTIGRIGQGYSPAQMEQFVGNLPTHLRHDVHQTRVAGLTDLPSYLTTLAAIPREALQRPPYTGYHLPAPYNPHPEDPTILSHRMSYDVGNGYVLSGDVGVAGEITGPNNFYLTFTPRGQPQQWVNGRMLPLNANTPFSNRVEMMKALSQAATSAQ
jgi:hypothetical protein